jgi:hypothetical protein
MIQVNVIGDNFDDIIRLIETVEFPDLSPLIEPLKQIMIDDNRDGLLANTDSYGHTMTELEPATWHGRKGSGPPLVPEGATALMITDYQVEPAIVEPLHLRMIGYWPNLHWVRFHVTGTKYMVQRDPTGIRPASLPKVEDALENFARTLVGG